MRIWVKVKHELMMYIVSFEKIVYFLRKKAISYMNIVSRKTFLNKYKANILVQTYRNAIFFSTTNIIFVILL